MAKSRENTVDLAYAHLRAQLVAFEVKPGNRLNESEIASGLSMSRAPVREALNRLIADGFVSFVPGRGFFSRRFSVSEMADLYAVRRDLELGALSDAMAGASDDAIAGFVATWSEEAPIAADLDALVDRDEQFHQALAALSGNAARLHYLTNINDRIRFVRRINLEGAARRQGALAEHDALIEAVSRRDGAGAKAVLRAHLDRSTDEVRVQVQNALAQIFADEVA
ncbi:GntR family transcriptional regulator [Aestuariivita sp.]|jgi:DNA-binding GntR family transcriptional regulator|uniref:GntR family transcriptional regulator n=1 Tax=Aestuariivita sp. TaxID=1872407 RepID=UPI00216EA5A4|nr:GntR family transcriptional regulator [Aestuariivita sp.]MCE8007697.1 GntR family transcriptional regulator [Aestuariivita sp.]